MRVGRRTYDLLYRTWAPWDRVGVRPELRTRLDRGEVAPATHPRAIDLGCGTGVNAVELAARGFEVTGIDLSGVAIAAARRRAADAGVADRCRWIQADLTDPGVLADEAGRFDLLLDVGTIDDLDRPGRQAVAALVARLARPGATLLCWCFYAHHHDLPWISFTGPSRMTPAIEPGEEQALFGASFALTQRDRPGDRLAFLAFVRRRDDPRPERPTIRSDRSRS